MTARLLLVLSLLLSHLAAAAQFTQVTGTVLDPSGVPYAQGTITAALVLNGVTPTLNGGSFAMTGSAGLDSTGSFLMQLADNNVMVPSGLQWQFTVCSALGTVLPAGGPGPVCFVTSLTITGTSQNISVQLNAAAPALTLVKSFSFQGIYSEPGLQLISITPVSTAAAGLVDLYTVPAGKRAFLLSQHFNAGTISAASTYSLTPNIKISGTYYPTKTLFSVGANLSSQISNGLVAEAGQTISINVLPTIFTLTQVTVAGATTTYTGTITGGGTNLFAGETFLIAGFTNSGNNVLFTVISNTTTTLVGTTSTQVNETHAGTAIDQAPINIGGIAFVFPNTSSLRSHILTSFVNGNNTLFTCCAAGTSHFYVAGWTAIHDNNTTTSTATYANTTGAARNITMNLVPSGGTPLASNQIAHNAALGGASPLTTTIAGVIVTVMGVGDFINVASDSSAATQFAYVTGYEY